MRILVRLGNIFFTCKYFLFLDAHQLKRGYALNLSILVSAAQKQKLTRIPSVTSSEVGDTENEQTLEFFV